MIENLRQVIRLDQFPVYDEDFRASCRGALDQDGLLVLPGFLTDEALDAVRAEGTKNSISLTIVNKNTTST